MLFGLVTTVAAPLPDVAFVARYYKQGRAKSYYRVYVCRHDGSGRKAVSPVGRDAHGVLWTDSTHIAYTMDADGVSSDPSLATTRKIKVVRYDLTAGSSKEVGQFEGDSMENYDNARRRIVRSGGSALSVTDAGLKEEKISEKEFDESFGERVLGEKVKETDETVQMQAKVGGHRLEWTAFPYLDEVGTVGVKVTRGKDEKTVTLKGDTLEDAWETKRAGLIVVARPVFTKFFAGRFVYQVDVERGEAKVLLEGVSELDFDPARPIWVGAGPNRKTLSKLATGKQVYTSELFAGDWTRGKRWPLATGLVAVSNFGLAPR